MNPKSRLAPLPLFLLTLLVPGCGPGQPAKDDILNALNANLSVSQPYQFTDLQPDYYPQSDGSVTVKGTVAGKLKDDLYERADYEDRIRELGYDDGAWKRAQNDAQTLREPYRDTLLSQIPGDLRNHVEPVLIKIATPSGSDASFNFVLSAAHGQNGWSFSDDQLVPSSPLRGSPRASFGSDALVVGSDEEKTKDQAYVSETQTFIEAVGDAKKAIQAEDDKTKQVLSAATASGKTYLGTWTWANASWPIGLSISDQQPIGIGISLKGYLFDPATPTHKIDVVGNIELDPGQTEGRPIRFTTVHASGIAPSLARQGNGTDILLGGQAWADESALQLALDAQGNLIGSARGGQLNFAPKP